MSTHRKGPAPHRYTHFHLRRTQDQRFRALSPMAPSAQGLLLYLLGCPASLRVPGVIAAGRAQLAERLGWSVEDFERCFEELRAAGYCEADWDAGVIYLPDELREEDNAPQSPNTAKTWRGELDNAPQCALIERVVKDVLEVLRAADARRIAAERSRGQVVAACWVPAFMRTDGQAEGKRPWKKPSSTATSEPSSEVSSFPSGNPDPSPDRLRNKGGDDLVAREDFSQHEAPPWALYERVSSTLPPLELREREGGNRVPVPRDSTEAPSRALGYCLDPERCLASVYEQSGPLLKHGHLVPSQVPTALGNFRMHRKFRQMWSATLQEYFEELYTTEAEVLRELAHFGRFLAKRGQSENLYDLCKWKAERFVSLMAEAHAWDESREIVPSAGRTPRRDAPATPSSKLPYYLPAAPKLPKAEAVDGAEVLAELRKLTA